MIPYGADYNPEQWPEEVWKDDVRLMHGAGLNTATIGVFSWVKLQPGPGRLTFDWLDRLIELLTENDIQMILATPTAAPPAWLCRAHPDILPVTQDGTRYSYGSRRHCCPNSPSFRSAAREIAGALAERYGHHPSLYLWHIDNEFGMECYCDQCEAAFRVWLRDRYGELDALNDAWNTSFWSQSYGDWDEVLPPRVAPASHSPGRMLDYRRFMSDSSLACFLEQKETIREHSPDIPVTTNFMGWFKGLDYWSWAPHLDVISWDNYPAPGAPPYEAAAWHDMMRSLKRKPFLLMEQSPGQVNWMPINRPQRPDEVRLRSYQALAHGADGLCYFQFRQSRGGPEQFHAGIVSHTGQGNARVYREVAQIGAELPRMAGTLPGSMPAAKVAIVFDWDSWWTSEQKPAITTELSYKREMLRYYQPLWQRNVAVDFVSPQGPFDGYELVIAPCLRIVSEESATRLTRYAREGGSLIVTFGSGLTDEHDRAVLGGYPGPLRELLGVWVEEMDPLQPDETNEVRFVTDADQWDVTFRCDTWCDVIHLQGADPLTTFTSDYYARSPAITTRRVGEGKAIYVGTGLDQEGTDALLRFVEPDLIDAPSTSVECEITARSHEAGTSTFYLNFGDEPITVSFDGQATDALTGERCMADLIIPGKGVRVLFTPPHA